MLVTRETFIFNALQPHLFDKKNGRNFRPTVAQKRDASKNPTTRRKPNTLIARSAIAVLGLGFIDAGYSGDWSRIGVISKETEDLLKLWAFVVVPLCALFIFSVSNSGEPEA